MSMTKQKIFRVPDTELTIHYQYDTFYVLDKDSNILYDSGGTYAAALKFAMWYHENEQFILRGAIE